MFELTLVCQAVIKFSIRYKSGEREARERGEGTERGRGETGEGKGDALFFLYIFNVNFLLIQARAPK